MKLLVLDFTATEVLISDLGLSLPLSTFFDVREHFSTLSLLLNFCQDVSFVSLEYLESGFQGLELS